MYMKELKPPIMQQTPVYHEMTSFLASDKTQTILDSEETSLNGFKSPAPVHKHWCFPHAASTLVYARKGPSADIVQLVARTIRRGYEWPIQYVQLLHTIRRDSASNTGHDARSTISWSKSQYE